ncbi:hypothetical protein SO802_032363 [Lithocarpus litseifolius]|uniref:RNase H type-1 domain-containing protein n=1 Tax=Lithocarpus litseifolius TaxID=425828 RepID=A0AAW2BQC7_9ROSI
MVIGSGGVEAALELFAVTAWSLWRRRKKIRVEELATPLDKIPSEAQHYLHEFKSFNAAPMMSKPQRCIKWKPLVADCFKTNFDGAVFADTGEASIGVVVRNSKGEVMASLLEKIPNPSSTVLLELLAARRVALFMSEVGLDNSILEGDSDVIVNALNKGDLFNTTLGYLLKDALSFVSSLPSSSFSHTLR